MSELVEDARDLTRRVEGLTRRTGRLVILVGVNLVLSAILLGAVLVLSWGTDRGLIHWQ